MQIGLFIIYMDKDIYQELKYLENPYVTISCMSGHDYEWPAECIVKYCTYLI